MKQLLQELVEIINLWISNTGNQVHHDSWLTTRCLSTNELHVKQKKNKPQRQQACAFQPTTDYNGIQFGYGCWLMMAAQNGKNNEKETMACHRLEYFK